MLSRSLRNPFFWDSPPPSVVLPNSLEIYTTRAPVCTLMRSMPRVASTGDPFELKRLDDGYDPERCAANTRQFISEGVFALFGYVGTPTSLAALPLATEAKIPFFAPFTGAQSLREPFNRYVIHLRASYFDETAAMIKQATSVGITKIAVFYQNDSFGKAGLEGVTARDGTAEAATGCDRNSGTQFNGCSPSAQVTFWGKIRKRLSRLVLTRAALLLYEWPGGPVMAETFTTSRL